MNLAFGLGKLVVEGGLTLRLSPRCPRNVLQLSTTELALRDTQREMYALNLRPEETFHKGECLVYMIFLYHFACFIG